MQRSLTVIAKKNVRENLFKWCEILTYELSDQVIFTNSNQMNYMIRYFEEKFSIKIDREKCVVRPQPSLTRTFCEIKTSNYGLNDSYFNMGNFRNFYSNRSIGHVLDAIEKFNANASKKVMLDIFTGSEMPESVISHEYVRTGTLLPYFEFLNLSGKMDCLIVSDTVTEGTKTINPYLPSKLSDYLGSGAKIWALLEMGSPMSEYVQSGKIHVASEVSDDADKLVSALRKLADGPIA